MTDERAADVLGMAVWYNGCGRATHDELNEAISIAQKKLRYGSVVHAHWTDDGYCSSCGAPIPTDSRLDYIDESDCHFCYDCGASMDEKAAR